MTAVAAMGIGKKTNGALQAIKDSNYLSEIDPASVKEHTGGLLGVDACYVAETASTIILAFRGTLGAGSDFFQDLTSLIDWLNDFNAEPVSAAPAIPYGQVHSGFYASVSNLAPAFTLDILGRLIRNKKKVVLTGYSKGAGMAPLAACLLRSSGIIVDEVHLYEPPRCGDVNFKLAYDPIFPNTTRYEYQDDLVPHTPPSPFEMALLDSSSSVAGILHALYPDHDSWNYCSVGKLQFVDWENQIRPDSNSVDFIPDDLAKQRLQHLQDDFATSSKAHLGDHMLNGHLFQVLAKGATYPTWVDGPG
jgi:hypothetical protein